MSVDPGGGATPALTALPTPLTNGHAPGLATVGNGVAVGAGGPALPPNGVIGNNEAAQDENCNYDYSTVPMAGKLTILVTYRRSNKICK